MRVEGIFLPEFGSGIQESTISMSFSLSSSDISFLPAGKAIRGVVSNNPNKYKIYELYINNLLFPTSTKQSDLFIALTPCKGLMRFFISDKVTNLFKEDSEMKKGKKFSHLDADGEIRVRHKQSKINDMEMQ